VWYSKGYSKLLACLSVHPKPWFFDTGHQTTSNDFIEDEVLSRDNTAQKSPSSYIARMNMGIEYEKSGNKEEALREYRIAVSLDPSQADADLHFRMGVMS
jgi:tetratricopeptide (TPR) repeat protein